MNSQFWRQTQSPDLRAASIAASAMGPWPWPSDMILKVGPALPLSLASLRR